MLTVKCHKLVAGFTLIELLVVLGVMTVLSSLLVGFGRGTKEQVRMVKDKAVFTSAVYRARSLTLQTYQHLPPECGYGLRVIDDHTYRLWRDGATNPDCSDSNKTYDGGPEDFEEPVSLSQGIKFLNFGSADFLRSILFVPPDPQVTTIPSSAPSGKFNIVIATEDGLSQTAIAVNRLGQIEPSLNY